MATYVPASSAPVLASGGPTITTYADASINGPEGIAAGADGALWFTNFGGSSIGRITTTGAITNYTAVGMNHPKAITAGPDGALWFVNYSGNSIGRIATDGTVTIYPEPASICGPCGPSWITAGPDGALWFVNIGAGPSGAGWIGRITTAGVITHFDDPAISNPEGITEGPDGALWFANSSGNSIGRVTTSGAFTFYTGTGVASPVAITAGPDGALWFTNAGSRSIGRISTAGVITNFGGVNIPTDIAAGSDGALWFTNGQIGRITTAGAVTGYSDPNIVNPVGIAAGPDGALWFTIFGTNLIGRITVPVVIRSITVSPTTTTFDTCKDSGGAATGGVLVAPDGICTTSGGDDITIANGPTAGHIDVAGNAAVPSDGGARWTLCGGGGPTCKGTSGLPGPDQLSEIDGSGSTSSPLLTTAAQCDTGFSSDCSASAGQSAIEVLQLIGPAASTDNSSTFTTVWTWTAVP